MTQQLTQPVKRHGGKSYLADWIIGNMPPRAKNPNKPDLGARFIMPEEYFGGGSVLLQNDPDGISEAIN